MIFFKVDLEFSYVIVQSSSGFYFLPPNILRPD